MVADGAFNHIIHWVDLFLKILNYKKNQNCIIGSKVTAILLNGWVLPIGGVASGKVWVCSLRRRPVFYDMVFKFQQTRPGDLVMPDPFR